MQGVDAIVTQLLRLAVSVVDQVASSRGDGSWSPHSALRRRGTDTTTQLVEVRVEGGQGTARRVLGQENDGLQQVNRLGERGPAGAGQSLGVLDDLPRRVGERDVVGKLLERPSVGRTAPGWLRRRVQVVLTVPMRIRRRPSI